MVGSMKYVPFNPQRVVELRAERNLSRAALATAADVPFGTLTALELGYNVPNVDNVARVAAALDVGIGDLFVGDPVEAAS
jgi:transcriptional regulator with XRE-family HTH domain